MVVMVVVVVMVVMVVGRWGLGGTDSGWVR